jgi:DNA sulfur modification protein DndC
MRPLGKRIMIKGRIAYITKQFIRFPSEVYIGFSGGKDSSTVVKLLYTAAQALAQDRCTFTVTYCDTGVENPVVDRYVKGVLQDLDHEAQIDGMPFRTKIIQPSVEQSFFVRLIGRGYPPPTNSFRWCTKDIRIRPFRTFLEDRNGQTLIAIGTRAGESQQRDRSLKKSVGQKDEEEFYQIQRDGFPGAILFTPIIDFSTFDVWEALTTIPSPKCISGETLARLYKDGSGECPAIRDFKDKPCSRARFGCWTCTVVRRDRSAEGLIQRGYEELVPYFEFRRWLMEIRNNAEYRCRYRRNGQPGPGPFNLGARRMILGRLDSLEVEIQEPILTPEQRSRILELWQSDLSNEEYLASE